MTVTRGSIVRVGIFLFAFILCVGLSAILSTWFVVKQLAAAMQQQAPEVAASAAPAEASSAPQQEIDFFAATGITRDELSEFLANFALQEHVDNFPALLTFQNQRGDYLVESRVIVRWDDGEYRLLVGKTGVVQFLLTESMLAGLTLIVPPGYDTVRQRSFPLGTAYEPEEKLNTTGLPFHVNYDGHTRTTISRGLARLRGEGRAVSAAEFAEQLDRRSCTLALPTRQEAVELSPEEIFQQRRDTVVIVAHLLADGQQTQATGFVLASSGVIATNYHVVDKPDAVVRAILTSDGRMFPITGVLAADRAGDVAILQTDATGLTAAPLADAAVEGARVTLISHPNSSYFSLSDGCITRYWADTQHGRVTLRMGVTAEFAGGSSGAPLFDSHGNVAGMVSSTANVNYQMVNRMAIPSQTILQLVRSPGDRGS